MMRKLLISLLLLFFLGIFLAKGPLIAYGTRAGLGAVSSLAEKRGVEWAGLAIEKADLNGAGLFWGGISGRLKLHSNPYFSLEKDLAFSVKEIRLAVRSWKLKVWQFSLNDLRLRPSDGSGEERLEIATLKIPFEFDLLNPARSLKHLRSLCGQIQNLAREGRTQLPLELSGTFYFNVGESPAAIEVKSVRQGQDFVLVMERDKLRAVSEYLTAGSEEKMSEVELDLLSQYPTRAPKLLQFMKYAQDAAKQARSGDPSVPEDAYRHVLWSYLLTEAYGEKFSELITNAHELGDLDSTTADHAMDYHNNALGRQYALSGYPKAGLLEKVLTDPEVRKTPR